MVVGCNILFIYHLQSHQASVSTRLTQFVSFGLMGREEERVEFVKMRGPGGKGYAEMAVKKISTEVSPIIYPISAIKNVNVVCNYFLTSVVISGNATIHKFD